MDLTLVDDDTLAKEAREKTFVDTTSLCTTKSKYVPDDGIRSGIEQAFAFTVPMKYYTSSSQTFGDVKQGCAESDQFLHMMLVFFYLCEALRKAVDYPFVPAPRPPTSKETNTGTGRKRSRRQSSGDGDDESGGQEEEGSPDHHHRRRRRVESEEETASDNENPRVRKAVDDLIDATFESREEFRRNVQIFTCLEYVPYEATTERQPYARFMRNTDTFGDIFDNEDPYRHFRNLFINRSAACYTIHVLTRTRLDFNRALNRLICDTTQLNESSIESTVFLSRTRISAFDPVSADDLVIPEQPKSQASDDQDPEAERLKREKAISQAANDRNGVHLLRSRLQKRHMYRWLSVYSTTPSAWLNMVDSYLGTHALRQLSISRSIALPPYAEDNPLNATVVFSVANALRVRPFDVCKGQRLIDYGAREEIYFRYPDENEELARHRRRRRPEGEQEEERGRLWVAPFPKRIMWLHPNILTPANMIVTRLPELDILGANPFEAVYPNFYNEASLVGPGAGDGATTPDGVSDDLNSFVPYPCVGERVFTDIPALERLIGMSKAIHRQRRNSSSSDMEESDDFFTPSELRLAIQEHKRYTEKTAQWASWNIAYEACLRKTIPSRSIGVVETFSSAQGDNIQIVMKPPSQLTLEEYYADPNLCDKKCEQINVLYRSNKTLKRRLLDYFESPNTTLTPIDKECMIRVYETHVAKQYKMSAGSSESRVPQVSREINRFVEEKGLFSAQKRVRNLHIMAPDLDPLSNFLIWCLDSYKVTLDIALCDVLLLIWLCSLDSSRCDSKLKLNILIAGEGGISKSHLVRKLTSELRIPRTSREETSNTPAGYNTDDGAGSNFETRVIHEASKTRLVGKDEDGKGDPLLKEVLDSQCVTTRAATIDPKTGKVKKAIRFNEQIGIYILCTNVNINNLDSSVLGRFLVLRLFQNPNIANAMVAESGKRPCDGIFVSELQWVHHFIQAVNHEIQMLIGVQAFPPPNTALMNVVVHHINNRLKASGHKGFMPRDIMKLNAIASLLCIVDIIVTEFLYPGGRYYHEDVTPERLVSLAPCMFVKKHHVVQTIKMMTQYAFVHGESAVRSALEQIATDRKRQIGDVSVMYAISNATLGKVPGHQHGTSLPRERYSRRGDAIPVGALSFNGASEFSNNSAMFSNYGDSNSFGVGRSSGASFDGFAQPQETSHKDRDWNYHFFRCDSFRNTSLFTQVASIASQQGGTSLTADIVRMIVNDLSKRMIQTPRYTKSAVDDPMVEPRPRIWMPGVECPCNPSQRVISTSSQSGDSNFCELHSKTSEMVAKVCNEGVYIATAWLREKSGKSVEEIIDETLHDFFNHKYQEPFKTVGDASQKYQGTFNVFEVSEFSGSTDTRSMLQIPNANAITEIEHEILHSATRVNTQSSFDDECDQYNDSLQIDKDYWTTPVVDINFDLNVWVALVRANELYRTGSRISFRQMLKSFYSFGSKVHGLIDSKSILYTNPFDENDPRLRQYNGKSDIDCLDERLRVPDPSKGASPDDLVPFSRVFGEYTNIMDEEGFRRLYVCYIDIMILLHARNDPGARFVSYPDDIRRELESRFVHRTGKPAPPGVAIPMGQMLGLSETRQQNLLACTRKMSQARKQLTANLQATLRTPRRPRASPSSTEDRDVIEDIMQPEDSGSRRERLDAAAREKRREKAVSSVRVRDPAPGSFMSAWAK